MHIDDPETIVARVYCLDALHHLNQSISGALASQKGGARTRTAVTAPGNILVSATTPAPARQCLDKTLWESVRDLNPNELRELAYVYERWSAQVHLYIAMTEKNHSTNKVQTPAMSTTGKALLIWPN